MATLAQRRGLQTVPALILLLGASLLLNYVDRGAIGVAAPLMKSDLGLSATAFGLAVSAFFWIYAPVQLVLGWLCDRFSVYRLLALGTALWSASTLLMGFVGGFLSLFLLRMVLGIGESIIFPGSSKMICRHVPAERRGLANAVVTTGVALGPGGWHAASAGRSSRRSAGARCSSCSASPARCGCFRGDGCVRPLPVSDERAIATDCPGAEGDRPLVAVGDGHRPRDLELRPLFHARLSAAVPGSAARADDPADDDARDARLRRPGGFGAHLRQPLGPLDSRRRVGAADSPSDARWRPPGLRRRHHGSVRSARRRR